MSNKKGGWTGSKNPRWKGGRHRQHGGYVFVFRPKHPNADRHGYVREHVLVMSRHLGRALRSWEVVHHVNGVRTDNRLENLELWSSSHPSGQRVADKIAWAREILAQYEDLSIE